VFAYADVSWISDYPTEKEILLSPCYMKPTKSPYCDENNDELLVVDVDLVDPRVNPGVYYCKTGYNIR